MTVYIEFPNQHKANKHIKFLFIADDKNSHGSFI